MFSLLVDPAILCLLLWIVASREADIDYRTMFFIAICVGLAGAFTISLLGDSLLVLVLVPLTMMVLLVFLLIRFCGVDLTQALIVAAAFFAYKIAFALWLRSLIK
ncbi:MAG: hypothetical protein K2W96_12405 [Gemmataceae bacterium]|nr:hypothetical protein [Gemmataceae bacterium]